MRSVRLVLSVLVAYAACWGRAGDLDTSFGYAKRGYTLTGVGTKAVTGRALVEQWDGKLVAIGNYYDSSADKYSVLVTRYSSLGITDSSFGTAGIVRTTISQSTVAQCGGLQATGKIIVAGTYDKTSSSTGIIVLRYTTRGVLDKTFGSGKGYVQTFISPMSEASTLIIDSQDRIIIGGWYYDTTQEAVGMLLVRYTAAGVLDTTFGTRGYIKRFLGSSPSVLYALLQNAQYLFASGSMENSKGNEDCVVLKMTMSGALVSSYGASKGYTRTAIASTQRDVGIWLAQQPDNKIVIVGEYFDSSKKHFKPFLVRYKTNGLLDTTFGSAHTGIVKTSFSSGDDFVSSVSVADSNSKIVITGSCVENFKSKLVLARFKTNGIIDTTFGSNGVSKMSLSESWSNGSLIINNKLVVVGGSNYSTGINRLMIARFKLS